MSSMLVIGQRSDFTFYGTSLLLICAELKKKNIRMELTIFKNFICGGLSPDICSENMLYGSADALP